MQSTHSGEVNGFESSEDLEELFMGGQEKMESGEADEITIAELPKQGQEVEINGLKYKVQQITKSDNVILEPKGKS